MELQSKQDTKTTIKLPYTGVSGASKLAVWEVLHREQSLNSSQQVVCWNSSRINIELIQIV